jgi:glycosyltransferase involved in cell wall biosynthesis
MADHLDLHVFPMAVALPEHGPLEGELRRRHVPFEMVPLSPFWNPFSVRALSRLIREWKPDIVQGHGAQSNFYARLAAGRVLCLSTIHNAIADYPVRAWRKGLYSAADKLTARRSAAVVCVAECLREEFLRRCPGLWERTHVIPNGVDLERYDPSRYSRDLARRTFELGDRWTILVPGRLAVGKGHAQLLEAVARIRNILPPFRILFAGEGPLADALRQKARSLGMEADAVFLGVRQDIPELLAAADVVVLPSVAEGLPAALLEALAMEEPVIASDVTGVSEVMPSGEEGYRVPPGSVEKLSETLLRLLWDKEDARRRGEAGRHRVQREYDLKKILAKWEALYRELAGDVLIE